MLVSQRNKETPQGHKRLRCDPRSVVSKFYFFLDQVLNGNSHGKASLKNVLSRDLRVHGNIRSSFSPSCHCGTQQSEMMTNALKHVVLQRWDLSKCQFLSASAITLLWETQAKI